MNETLVMAVCPQERNEMKRDISSEPLMISILLVNVRRMRSHECGITSDDGMILCIVIFYLAVYACIFGPPLR
jgi:hypothetical protein